MSKKDPDGGRGASRLHSTMQRPRLGLPWASDADRQGMVDTIKKIEKYIQAQTHRTGFFSIVNSQIKGQIWRQVEEAFTPILEKMKANVNNHNVFFYKADADALNEILALFQDKDGADKKADTKDVLKDLPGVIAHLGQWLGTTPYSKALLDDLVGMARSKDALLLVKALLKDMVGSVAADTDADVQTMFSTINQQDFVAKLNVRMESWPFEKMQQLVLAETIIFSNSIEKGSVLSALVSTSGVGSNPGKIFDALFEGVEYSREEMTEAKRKAIEAAPQYKEATDGEIAILPKDIEQIRFDLEKLSAPIIKEASGKGEQEYSGMLDQMVKAHGAKAEIGGGSKTTESVTQDQEQGFIQECKDLKAQLEKVSQLRRKLVDDQGELRGDLFAGEGSEIVAKIFSSYFLSEALLNTDRQELCAQSNKFLSDAEKVINAATENPQLVQDFVVEVYAVVEKKQELVSSHQKLLWQKEAMPQACKQVWEGLKNPTRSLQAQRVWYQHLQTAVVNASVQVVENGCHEPLLEVEPVLPVDPLGGIDGAYLEQMKKRLETIQEKGGYEWSSGDLADRHADVTAALAQTRVKKVNKGGYFSGSTTTFENELNLNTTIQDNPSLFVKLLVLARIPDDVLDRALSEKEDGGVEMWVRHKDGRGAAMLYPRFSDENNISQFNQSFLLKQLFDKVDAMSKVSSPCVIYCSVQDSLQEIDVPSCSQSEIQQLLVGANKEVKYSGRQTEVKAATLKGEDATRPLKPKEGSASPTWVRDVDKPNFPAGGGR